MYVCMYVIDCVAICCLFVFVLHVTQLLIRDILSMPCLTNREAFAILFSIIKHAGSGLSTEEAFLQCSSCFLSALQQNRAQSRVVYNKESVKFRTHYFQFSKQTLFAKRTTAMSPCFVLSSSTLQ